jgi:UDPglucose--hexose-1-phosphate uridylyltransferase
MDKTEMRLDPLTEAWTIFSEARTVPPAFGPIVHEAESAHLADPFRAGLERFAPHTLHDSPANSPWQVRVVPNAAPVLRVEGDATRHGDGFYDHMDGVGAHEVIIEDPGARRLEELSVPEIQQVIAAWKFRMLDLMRDQRMHSFAIVKNVGRAAGALVGHSLSQLIAMAVVYPLLKRKLELAEAFYQQKKRSIFEDILNEEVRTGTRLVYENNGFALFCPYAARAPFELAIYPKRQCPDFHGLSDQEVAQFADVLRIALQRLARALDHPAYNLMLFTAPTRFGTPHRWATLEQDFRWHVEILPRLHHLGGVELATGCWLNSVWPETAADYLREIAASES